jgi:hypothetical protein
MPLLGQGRLRPCMALLFYLPTQQPSNPVTKALNLACNSQRNPNQPYHQLKLKNSPTMYALATLLILDNRVR